MSSQVAIVTGGSKGIGLAIARALLDRNMQVVISARKQDELAKAQQQLGGSSRVHAVRGDVGVPGDAERLINAAVQRFGAVDVLVNNAGVGRFANVTEMSTEDWRQVIDTNLSGVFYCTRAALPRNEAPGRGLDHQYQQPGRQELVRRCQRVLRVEGRVERVQRGADAGSASRQHSRELRDARLGIDGVRRSRR